MKNRNNISVTGRGERTIVFAHGFGCDKSMWRQLTPAFEKDHKVVTFDLTGAGDSDLSAYDFGRYADLQAHAEDVLRICDELSLEDVILVGHSISATIAVLAANAQPERFRALVLVAPTPSFMNDADYRGGFSREDIEGLTEMIDANYLGWSQQMAPTIAGQAPGEPAADDLTQSFCRTDPRIAQHFARVTFYADCREDMKRLSTPSLILHCDDDPLVPMEVGDWMQANIPGSRLEILTVSGHCPHMTAPEQTIQAMRRYLT
jgi:sigma-B regulation protein RsbQ